MDRMDRMDRMDISRAELTFDRLLGIIRIQCCRLRTV